MKDLRIGAEGINARGISLGEGLQDEAAGLDGAHWVLS